MITAGIDVGSTTTKLVLLEDDSRVLAQHILLTGFRPIEAAQKALDVCCKSIACSPDNIAYTVSTGYGRELIDFADEQITEITCHAQGAHFLFPEARGVIDIGGQDSKAISLDPETGHVITFAMNDRCAAGTGRFLDVMAGIMGITPKEMGELSLKSEKEVAVSSICTVFAESEVISLISQKNVNPYDIMAGIHSSVARRVTTLTGRAQLSPSIVMTGGVAKNVGVVHAFETVLKTKLLIPEEPQSVGALGAAHIAAVKLAKRVCAEKGD